jgi:hypothetical protein
MEDFVDSGWDRNDEDLDVVLIKEAKSAAKVV